MRLLLLILGLIASHHIYGQYSFGFLPEFFFGRQSNARAESLGMGYASVDKDLGGVYFNPASTASLKGLSIIYSNTPPEYYSTKGFYSFMAISYKLNKKNQISISQFKFDYGKTQIVNVTEKPIIKKTNINFSSEINKNFLIGLSTNFFFWRPGNSSSSKTIFFDLGIIRKNIILNSLNFGISISNFNHSSTSTTFQNVYEKFNLPVISRFALSYSHKFGGKLSKDTSVSPLEFFIQTEYQKIINSEFRSSIKFGCEMKIFNLFSLRGGWYKEKISDFGLPLINKNTLSSITYGLGFNLPLKKIIHFPFNIQVDYVSLPQVSYLKQLETLPNFKTIDVKLSSFIF